MGLPFINWKSDNAPVGAGSDQQTELRLCLMVKYKFKKEINELLMGI